MFDLVAHQLRGQVCIADQLVNSASVRPPAAFNSAEISVTIAAGASGRRRSGRCAAQSQKSLFLIGERAADVELFER